MSSILVLNLQCNFVQKGKNKELADYFSLKQERLSQKRNQYLEFVQFLAKSNFLMLHVILCVENINTGLSFLQSQKKK